jgi:hypothetical protein
MDDRMKWFVQKMGCHSVVRCAPTGIGCPFSPLLLLFERLHEHGKYHVSVAAEAHAAAAFAQAGYEVSVQYGANQPGYDLVVVKRERILKVPSRAVRIAGGYCMALQERPDMERGSREVERLNQIRHCNVFCPINTLNLDRWRACIWPA